MAAAPGVSHLDITLASPRSWLSQSRSPQDSEEGHECAVYTTRSGSRSVSMGPSRQTGVGCRCKTELEKGTWGSEHLWAGG